MANSFFQLKPILFRGTKIQNICSTTFQESQYDILQRANFKTKFQKKKRRHLNLTYHGLCASGSNRIVICQV